MSIFLRQCYFSVMLFACHKPPASSVTDVQSAAVDVASPVQAPASVEAPTKEALLTAGFCANESGASDQESTGAIANVQPIPLPDGRVIYEVNCFMAAYQGTYEYAWSDLKPVLNQSDEPMTLVGLPFFDKGSMDLKWKAKARGVGDCGDWFWYVFVADRFRLKEHRHRACDDSQEITSEMIDGSKWPLVEEKVQQPPKTKDP